MSEVVNYTIEDVMAVAKKNNRHVDIKLIKIVNINFGILHSSLKILISQKLRKLLMVKI